MRPGRIVLATPTTAVSAGEALADGGDHVVAELDQVELVDRDRSPRQPGPQRLAERGRRIDRDDLDPLPPPLRTLAEPVSDGGAVASVDDAENLPGGQVDQGRHPRLEPSPGAVIGTEPAHRPVAVLIDAQPPHARRLDISQDHGSSCQGCLDQPPRDAVGPGHLGGCSAGADHGRDDLVP